MKRIKTSSIFVAVSVFFTFLLIRFPFQNLKGLIFGKIYKATGAYILADDIYPSLFGWPGLGMKNVSITIPVAGLEFDLECQKLIFKIGFSDLFPPTPSFSLYLKRLKKGGDLYIRFSQGKSGIRASVETTRLDLSQLNSSGSAPIATGTADVDVDLKIDNGNASFTTGNADIALTNFTLGAQNIQGIVLAEMKLGTVKGNIISKNGTASVESFQIGNPGSDLLGTMSGEIKLDPDWNNSLLSLALKLKLSDTYVRNPDSATITSFLNTFKVGEREYSIRLNASVAQFSQSSILLLQKGG